MRKRIQPKAAQGAEQPHIIMQMGYYKMSL